ncbi:glutamyl-tRNA reductase 1, chloroplastic [Tanacetum coccineum]
MVTRAKARISKPLARMNCHATTTSPIPRSHLHALRDPNWHKAMVDEYNALISNGTWALVPRPANANIIRFYVAADVKMLFFDASYLRQSHASTTRVPSFLTFTRPNLSLCVQQVYLRVLYVPGDNLLSWFAKRQVTLSRSSAEANIEVFVNVLLVTEWIRNFVAWKLHTPLSTATLVYLISSAVYLTTQSCAHHVLNTARLIFILSENLVAFRPRSLVYPLYVIKSPQSSMPIACDIVACGSITDIKSALTERALQIFCQTYHIPDEVHPQLANLDQTIHEMPIGKIEMDLLSFIQTVDPTKVRIGERQRAEGEPKLLDTTVGRVVPLLPVAPARASSELEASVDKLFDEGGSGSHAEQGDSVSGGHGVGVPQVSETAEIVAEDAALVQPRRQRKRKTVVSDADEPSHPPKKLREDHGTSTGPSVAGKSRFALQRLLARAVLNPEVGVVALPTLPFITSSVSVTPEREDEDQTDFMVGDNL